MIEADTDEALLLENIVNLVGDDLDPASVFILFPKIMHIDPAGKPGDVTAAQPPKNRT